MALGSVQTNLLTVFSRNVAQYCYKLINVPVNRRGCAAQRMEIARRRQRIGVRLELLVPSPYAATKRNGGYLVLSH